MEGWITSGPLGATAQNVATHQSRNESRSVSVLSLKPEAPTVL